MGYLADIVADCRPRGTWSPLPLLGADPDPMEWEDEAERDTAPADPTTPKFAEMDAAPPAQVRSGDGVAASCLPETAAAAAEAASVFPLREDRGDARGKEKTEGGLPSREVFSPRREVTELATKLAGPEEREKGLATSPHPKLINLPDLPRHAGGEGEDIAAAETPAREKEPLSFRRVVHAVGAAPPEEEWQSSDVPSQCRDARTGVSESAKTLPNLPNLPRHAEGGREGIAAAETPARASLQWEGTTDAGFEQNDDPALEKEEEGDLKPLSSRRVVHAAGAEPSEEGWQGSNVPSHRRDARVGVSESAKTLPNLPDLPRHAGGGREDIAAAETPARASLQWEGTIGAGFEQNDDPAPESDPVSRTADVVLASAGVPVRPHPPAPSPEGEGERIEAPPVGAALRGRPAPKGHLPPSQGGHIGPPLHKSLGIPVRPSSPPPKHVPRVSIGTLEIAITLPETAAQSAAPEPLFTTSPDEPIASLFYLRSL